MSPLVLAALIATALVSSCVVWVDMLALSSATGIKLAEVGFLLIVIAGIWLVASEVPALGLHRARTIVAGVALTGAGVLLIIATHWGHFG